MNREIERFDISLYELLRELHHLCVEGYDINNLTLAWTCGRFQDPQIRCCHCKKWFGPSIAQVRAMFEINSDVQLQCQACYDLQEGARDWGHD